MIIVGEYMTWAQCPAPTSEVEMPSFSEMVEAARPNVREVSAAEAKEMVEADPDALVLDVREPHEWDMGHIPGAGLLPLGHLDLVAAPSGPRAHPAPPEP